MIRLLQCNKLFFFLYIFTTTGTIVSMEKINKNQLIIENHLTMSIQISIEKKNYAHGADRPFITNEIYKIKSQNKVELLTNTEDRLTFLFPHCQQRAITFELTKNVENFTLKKRPGINEIAIEENSTLLIYANIIK